MKTMTLQEVIDACLNLLEKGVDGDTEVVTEGCDCDGNVVSISHHESSYGNFVYFSRHELESGVLGYNKKGG